MDIKMLNHVVLVLLCWLCRILQSLHPGGGHRDSCYTASTEKFLEECHRLLLCICSENQLCPKPSISPSSSRHRKTTWNLCVAVSHSWKMNYWEVGNLCSSKCRDEMAAVKITATPLRQNSATFELQAAWAREGERNHSRTGEAPRMPLSYLWRFGQTHIVLTHNIR